MLHSFKCLSNVKSNNCDFCETLRTHIATDNGREKINSFQLVTLSGVKIKFGVKFYCKHFHLELYYALFTTIYEFQITYRNPVMLL